MKPGKRVEAAQPVANAERGEHEITLGGKTYRMRPSHAAVREIERKTERSAMGLLRLGNTGDLSVDQLGIIGGAFIRAGAGDGDTLTANVDDERIGELIYEQGLPHASAVITMALLDAATGGRKASGERKAAAA